MCQNWAKILEPPSGTTAFFRKWPKLYIFLLLRLQNIEREYSRAQQELGQLRSVIERLRLDKAELEEQLNEVSF